MNAVLILMRKDLRAFFSRPLFYIIAALCTLIWSPVYFYAFGEFLSQLVGAPDTEFVTYHDRVITEFVALVNFVLLLFVNAVTMKLLAEEKKNRTYELLMTSPIKSWHIVAGKFLAGFVISAGLVLVAFLYPLTTAFLGRVDWGPLVCAYLGLMVFVTLYVSTGVLASAMTSSVMVSFLLSLIFNLSLWFLVIGSEIGDGGAIGRFFDYVSIEPIFKDFARGAFRVSALVYLLSLSFFACFCAERVVESSRWR